MAVCVRAVHGLHISWYALPMLIFIGETFFSLFHLLLLVAISMNEKNLRIFYGKRADRGKTCRNYPCIMDKCSGIFSGYFVFFLLPINSQQFQVAGNLQPYRSVIVKWTDKHAFHSNKFPPCILSFSTHIRRLQGERWEIDRYNDMRYEIWGIEEINRFKWYVDNSNMMIWFPSPWYLCHPNICTEFNWFAWNMVSPEDAGGRRGRN